MISCPPTGLIGLFHSFGITLPHSSARMYEFRVDQNKLNWSIDVYIYIRIYILYIYIYLYIYIHINGGISHGFPQIAP